MRKSVLLVLFLASCSAIPPKQDLTMPIQPLRELRAVIVQEDGQAHDVLYESIRKASDELAAQVGVTIRPVKYDFIQWRSNDYNEMFQQVHDTYWDTEPQFDIVIAIKERGIGNILKRNMIGGIDGIIEDVYRRYIILHSLDYRILMHEVFHCFMFKTVHSRTGITASIHMQLLPFTPPLMTSKATDDVRREVLANKFRDFCQKPTICSDGKQDGLILEQEEETVARQSQTAPVLTSSPSRLALMPSSKDTVAPFNDSAQQK